MNDIQQSSSPRRSRSAQAALLSALVIPGAGQIYNGQWGKGIFIAVLFLTSSLAVLVPISLAVVGYYLCITAGNVDNAGQALQPMLDQWIHLVVLACATVGVYVYSIVDAYRNPKREPPQAPPASEKTDIPSS